MHALTTNEHPPAFTVTTQRAALVRWARLTLDAAEHFYADAPDESTARSWTLDLRRSLDEYDNSELGDLMSVEVDAAGLAALLCGAIDDELICRDALDAIDDRMRSWA